MSELHNEQVAVPQDHPVYAAHIPGGRYTLQTTGSDPAWLSEPGKKGKGKVSGVIGGLWSRPSFLTMILAPTGAIDVPLAQFSC